MTQENTPEKLAFSTPAEATHICVYALSSAIDDSILIRNLDGSWIRPRLESLDDERVFAKVWSPIRYLHEERLDIIEKLFERAHQEVLREHESWRYLFDYQLYLTRAKMVPITE